MISIDRIPDRAAPLCYVLRPARVPEESVFPLDASLPLQVGFVARQAGQEIPRHAHARFERRIVGTAEVLVVLRGRCELDVYDTDNTCVGSSVLSEGEILVMVDGGHGFRMLEDTTFLEIKQGPYHGPSEKVVF